MNDDDEPFTWWGIALFFGIPFLCFLVMLHVTSCIDQQRLLVP